MKASSKDQHFLTISSPPPFWKNGLVVSETRLYLSTLMLPLKKPDEAVIRSRYEQCSRGSTDSWSPSFRRIVAPGGTADNVEYGSRYGTTAVASSVPVDAARPVTVTQDERATPGIVMVGMAPAEVTIEAMEVMVESGAMALVARLATDDVRASTTEDVASAI